MARPVGSATSPLRPNQCHSIESAIATTKFATISPIVTEPSGRTPTGGGGGRGGAGADLGGSRSEALIGRPLYSAGICGTNGAGPAPGGRRSVRENYWARAAGLISCRPRG